MTGLTQKNVARAAERGIRCGLLAVLVVAIRERNWGAIVNAVLALGGCYLPDIIEYRHEVEFSPWQRVYTSSAMATHAIGMLGPYDDTWWWDHLTHTHSSTLLAGAVHAVSRRRGNDPRPAVLTIVGCAGIVWEVIEYTTHLTAERYDLEPVLIPYGRRDMILDLCFNMLGALLALIFGDQLLDNLIQRDE